MIISSSQQKANLEERLRTKTMEQMLLGSIQEGANCPPFVAWAILDVAESTFNSKFNRIAQFSFEEIQGY